MLHMLLQQELEKFIWLLSAQTILDPKQMLSKQGTPAYWHICKSSIIARFLLAVAINHSWLCYSGDTLRPKQTCLSFADILKCDFLIENLCILLLTSLHIVPKGPMDNTLSLIKLRLPRNDKLLSAARKTKFIVIYILHPVLTSRWLLTMSFCC